MNSIDLAVLVIMALSCLVGIIRGVTKEILSVFTWIGSAYAAYTFYPMASHFARGYVANPMIADGITGAVLFILFLVLFGIVTVAISNAVKDSMVGGLDRSLGLAFGIFRGVFIICVIEIGFSLFVPREKQSELIQTARFTPMVRNGSDEVVSMLPLSVRDMIMSQTQKIQGIAPLTGTVQDLVVPQPKPLQQPDVMNDLAPMRPQTVMQPAAPLDAEKAAEGLSMLRPQVQQSKADGYDRRQQSELDRLIETSE
ncbi:MAG: CvpA family protein [Candidatus Paracaedibacteraceae bacterium]|nr:CvpA family protein [Candidatus Paracaedibacteraceae bacterium]